MHKEIENKISGSFGITNVLISFLSKGVSVGVLLISENKMCEVYIKSGSVKGLTCSLEEFTEISKTEDLNISLIPYEADVKLNTYLEDELLVLGLVSGILFELEKEMPREKYESLLDNLSEYADVKDGVVSKVFVDIRRFPELFLYVLHSVKPPPKTLLSALYKFVKAEIPIFTI